MARPDLRDRGLDARPERTVLDRQEAALHRLARHLRARQGLRHLLGRVERAPAIALEAGEQHRHAFLPIDG
jgi:hypothetical protein